MKIHDVSRPLEARTAAWPGDTEFKLSWSLRIADGESVNLSELRTSPHVGTHTDAPLHVADGARAAHELDLEAFLGPARVVDARPDSRGLIPPSVLDGLDQADFDAAPRLLFRTTTEIDWTHFPEDFPAFDPMTCERCAEAGVVLVGIDTPSVDRFDSKELSAHHALRKAGLHWLENLDLSRVEARTYELCALPLPIVGGCASPVRAVLIER